MSFYKDYPNRKDWRKDYRDQRSVDSTCRSHGSCGYCTNSRLYNKRKVELASKQRIEEYKECVQ